MKVLVTGADGQVGRAFMAARPPGLQLCPASRDVLDLTDSDQIRRCLDAERPGIVVNCAAYTAVDKAESEIATAMAVNRGGAAKLAAALAERGMALIHLSTDYVFDGCKPDPYVESDATAPIRTSTTRSCSDSVIPGKSGSERMRSAARSATGKSPGPCPRNERAGCRCIGIG